MPEQVMSKEDINRIMKNPNTWDWDGCTYSDMELDPRLISAEELEKRANEQQPGKK